MKILAAIVIFAGSAVLAVPSLLVGLVKRASPAVLFEVDTPDRMFALTIDDGPSSATLEILDVLRQHGARATFFMIGEHVRQLPDQVDSIRAAGGELGHHMMVDESSVSLEPQEFRPQFVEMDSILQSLGGSRWFRPGSGWYNDGIVHLAGKLGYRLALGSVYPFDAQLPFPGLASSFILDRARAGSIVILHDGPERGPRTAEVLRRVLPELSRRGYQVVTLSELVDGLGLERQR